jgi:ADP-ribose pyrophosphatase YjhB (NUDIX family)
MRQGVDHIGVTLVYFCHDGQGNFLMNLRSQNARDEQGRWDIGGGALEFGQTVEDTLSKEIWEEYCTNVLASEFLGYRDIHREHNGERTHWIALDFKVLVDRDKVQNGEPHKFDGVAWFTLGTIPTPAHSQFSEFVEKYRGRL